MRFFRSLAVLLVPSVSLASCAGRDARSASDAEGLEGIAADLPELEIRGTGVDRFAVCPPPGELGQHWIPPLAPWTPPPAPAVAPAALDRDTIGRTGERTPTELAVEATHRELRSCYRQGLVRHPTQEGRVALVLRVDASGRVAKVESYGACELAPESIACMFGVVGRLRFAPPAAGSDTITIPATFTSRDGVKRTVPTPNDAYTAAAYVALEAARPALHACEERARREGRAAIATGTFTMSVAVDGRVTKAHVDPWTGDQELLRCAAKSLETLRFKPPEAAQSAPAATVIARLNFNPRQGVR